MPKKPKEIKWKPVKLIPVKPDLKVFYEGSMSFVEPLSPAGRRWINEHVSQEGYQPYWPTIIVEHRYLDDLIEGAENDDLFVIGRERGGTVPSNVNLLDMLTGRGFPHDNPS